ncbi:MAG: low molecular weight phosphotyrosine protein phosphatase [Verrucomicrobia bacterium]|nr:low molecular weight phosphotyrosine protein phosphatase [Verrucomicrobiota bacterium]
MYKVLFVCMGNICRSPAGDNVFRHLVREAGLADRISCDSAGTLDYHVGKSPDPRMSAVLRRRGIPVEGRARHFKKADFQDFDLILTMDEDNRRNVLSLADSPADEHKVKPFAEFCSEHDLPEVPDPYYGGDEGFELVADLMEDGCTNLLEHIRKTVA